MAERVISIMVCSGCKSKNYHFVTGKKKERKLEISKFCRKCRKHTPHKETK
ncbi:MAG: 50S ribosomal protein L33 [Elusimicrobia bacterium RIFOXYA2_FULL_39_19]|nr:MAG: 50S ribosomal protein L33 [Elusimicrobia bacterium RIFOXYA2_FULL_39_19]